MNEFKEFVMENLVIVCVFAVLIGGISMCQKLGKTSSANTEKNNNCIDINDVKCFYPIDELPLEMTRDSGSSWNKLAYNCSISAYKKYSDRQIKVYVSFVSKRMAIEVYGMYAVINPLEMMATPKKIIDNDDYSDGGDCVFD